MQAEGCRNQAWLDDDVATLAGKLPLALDPARIAVIRERLRALRERWRALAPKGAITLSWPRST